MPKTKSNEELKQLARDCHNTKIFTYLNFAILLLLLAFVIGVVLKQLGF